MEEDIRGGQKRRGKSAKEGGKYLPTESNQGPLTLRDIGHYAYKLTIVMDRYSITAWGEY